MDTELKRRILNIEKLLLNQHNNWVPIEVVMERLQVSKRTVKRWEKKFPSIYKYRPSEKGCNAKGSTIKTGHLYNIQTIIDKVYIAAINDKNAA